MSYLNSEFSTKYTLNHINQLISECLADACKIKYNITEGMGDDITNTLIIEFFLFSSVIHYDVWSKLPKHKIKVIFKKGTNGESNLVTIMDFSTDKSLFCKEKIFTLKNFITEK